jgi:hypothetical protein
VALQVAFPCRGVFARQFAKLRHIVCEAGKFRIDDSIGTVSRHHASLPSAVPDHPVPAQIVERALGGGDRLDVELLEQGSRQKLRLRQAVGDMIIGLVGGRLGNRHGHAEHILEGVVEPQPRRRAAEQVIVLGKQPPDLAAVGFGGTAIGPRHAETFEADALRKQHAEDVVVGRDEQLRRIGKRLVLGIPARICVTMRADDRLIGNALIQFTGDSARLRINRKQPVRNQKCHPNPPYRPAPNRPFHRSGNVIC